MKKLILAVMLFCFVSLFNQPSAHASPILTQEILLEQNGTLSSIGSVSINVADSVEFFDPTYSAFSWVNFDLFGIQFQQSLNDNFVVDFDIDNLMAGFEYISFDVRDAASGLVFQGLFDVELTFLDVFSSDGELIAFFAPVLGDVNVAVPAPTTFGLMLMALFGLMLRRQAK